MRRVQVKSLALCGMFLCSSILSYAWLEPVDPINKATKISNDQVIEAQEDNSYLSGLAHRKRKFAATLLYELILYKWNESGPRPLQWTSKVLGEGVAPGNLATLYLGALPLLDANGNIPTDLRSDFKIGAVLTATERFEVDTSVFGNVPISPNIWNSAGVKQKIMELPDGGGYSPQEIEEAIAFIRESITAGLNVLVHCKAGRGRSASLVVCYLMKYINMDYDKALAVLKAARVQVGLNARQQAAVKLWAAQQGLM